MGKREKIVVIGSGSPLEHEICSLGRSLGHWMTSISETGQPQSDEPWVEGVVWIEDRCFTAPEGVPARIANWLEGSKAIVFCQHGGVRNFEEIRMLIRRLADTAEEIGAEKFVWVLTSEGELSAEDRGRYYRHYYNEEIESDLLSRSFAAVILRPTIVFGQGIAMQVLDGSFLKALPVECVAMAALRAALEPETRGVLEREAIELYGDAMMIQ